MEQNFKFDTYETLALASLVLLLGYFLVKRINFLKKYDFNWYVDRIIPHINKMIEAKEGNIDTNYFKSFIQDEKITESMGGNNCLPPELRKKSEIKVKVDLLNNSYFG